MEDDELVRNLFWGLLVLSALVGLVGGFLTPIAGSWRDDSRPIRLRQFGPLVWGESTWEEGWQRFWGYAWGGRVLLYRRDYGAAHLVALGFTPEQVPLVMGQVTGHFRLRRQEGALAGHFVGRHFRIEAERLADPSTAPPSPRRWTAAD